MWWMIHPGAAHMRSFNLASSLWSWQVMTKWQPCLELFGVCSAETVPLQLSMLVSPKVKAVLGCSESQKLRRLNSLYTVWMHCWLIFNVIPFLFNHPVGKAFHLRALPLGLDFFFCLDLYMSLTFQDTAPAFCYWAFAGFQTSSVRTVQVFIKLNKRSG